MGQSMSVRSLWSTNWGISSAMAGAELAGARGAAAPRPAGYSLHHGSAGSRSWRSLHPIEHGPITCPDWRQTKLRSVESGIERGIDVAHAVAIEKAATLGCGGIRAERLGCFCLFCLGLNSLKGMSIDHAVAGPGGEELSGLGWGSTVSVQVECSCNQAQALTVSRSITKGSDPGPLRPRRPGVQKYWSRRYFRRSDR